MTETVITHPENHEPVAFTLALLDWLPWLEPPAEAALTGESMPAEKHGHASTSACEDQFELSNVCFMGANVVSGYGTGVVLQTGRSTLFGQLAHEIAGRRVPTAFDQGINKFTWLMIRFIIVMDPAVF